MKQTEIYYKKKDGKIEIVDFKNDARIVDIQKEFGHKVQKRYFLENSFSYYYFYSPTNQVYVWDGKFLFSIQKGSIFNIDTFNNIIKTMKEAGNKFQKIVKEVEQSEIKMVKI